MLSNITIVIGGKKFEMSPRTYLLNGEDLNPNYQNTCFIGIMPLPDVLSGYPFQLYILGDVFIRSFYSVFDYDYNEVSLGINKNSKNLVDINDA